MCGRSSRWTGSGGESGRLSSNRGGGSRLSSSGGGGSGRLSSGGGRGLDSGRWGGSHSDLRSAGGRRSRRSRRRRRRNGSRARSTDSEVDTRLVGLVDGFGVPVPLQHTVTGGSTLASETIGNGDTEAGLIGLDTGGGGCIDIPGDQRGANDLVGGSGDDGDVGDTGVGGADVDSEGDLLSCGVGLDVVLVIGKLVALAKPDVALGGVIITLAGGNLELALDVAVLVGALVGQDLLATGGAHCGTGLASFWLSDEAMGVDQGNDAGEGQSGGEVLHV